MYDEIIFNESAFKHGVTEWDIRQAIDEFICEDPLEDFFNKYLLFGFDTRGNLLEIMYNYIGERSINVFHAMPCRKTFYKLLPRRFNYGEDD
jgi:hypothetical protein